jgi:hypothetical protein
MTLSVLINIAATLVAGYLMLVSGATKGHLDRRTAHCGACGRHRLFCKCGRRT